MHRTLGTQEAFAHLGDVGVLFSGMSACLHRPKSHQGSLPFSVVTRNDTSYGHTPQDRRLPWEVAQWLSAPGFEPQYHPATDVILSFRKERHSYAL